MRIIAGKHSSRKLVTLPGSSTRPTLDKVRGAVFS
ncbi:MAG: RsmD family RNA methyltransferase, partial [Erysipelotrichaceae bacterium]|nr:RsmD family RNA methyltransferase [Erysipelotrichaceae bacterium]